MSIGELKRVSAFSVYEKNLEEKVSSEMLRLMQK